jgi:hypothetical protein
MRFHLDESADGRIAAGLRCRGIDVTTPSQAGLRSAADESHLAFALAKKRVLVTFDADFVVFHHAGAVHAGIVFCPPASRPIGEIIRNLCLIHDCLTPDEMSGRVEFV